MINLGMLARRLSARVVIALALVLALASSVTQPSAGAASSRAHLTVLVDDFRPQPLHGEPVRPYTRLETDRGRIDGPGRPVDQRDREHLAVVGHAPLGGDGRDHLIQLAEARRRFQLTRAAPPDVKASATKGDRITAKERIALIAPAGFGSRKRNEP